MFLIRKIIKLLFLALLIWFIVRTFLFQVYRIPSASMHGTLFEGDYVVINKLAYGARIPMTPLSLSVGGKKKFLDWIQLPYMRVPGYSEIKRNDIVAFNFDLTEDLPVDLREEYIKRCVAISGDTIEIVNGKVYVNKELNEPSTIYKNYTVVSDQPLDSFLLKRLNIFQNSFTADQKTYSFYMSDSQSDSLQKLPYIKTITQQPLVKDYYHPSVFPNYAALKWNLDFFGPLYIPKKGDSILLSKENLVLYQRTLERFEEAEFQFKGDSVFVNEKFSKFFLVKNNYFFVMGDNRYNSIDSRVWGFIPENHVIGKAGMKFAKTHKWEFSLQ
ncbi:signal peptidase I [Sphingobacteriaceae bacterium]|nr:signal peptidase I [Sphingobacteriaceae bacterium]